MLRADGAYRGGAENGVGEMGKSGARALEIIDHPEREFADEPDREEQDQQADHKAQEKTEQEQQGKEQGRGGG